MRCVARAVTKLRPRHWEAHRVGVKAQIRGSRVGLPINQLEVALGRREPGRDL